MLGLLWLFGSPARLLQWFASMCNAPFKNRSVDLSPMGYSLLKFGQPELISQYVLVFRLVRRHVCNLP